MPEGKLEVLTKFDLMDTIAGLGRPEALGFSAFAYLRANQLPAGLRFSDSIKFRDFLIFPQSGAIENGTRM